MALFDVHQKSSNSKIIKIEKVSKENSSEINGFNYIKTITSSTKAMALKQIQKELDSGTIGVEKKENKVKNNPKLSPEIKEDLPTIEEFGLKKAIYCDFNGVLNDPVREKELEKVYESDFFKVPKSACPLKIIKLVKLAMDTNSDLVLTSMWRIVGIDFYMLIARCLNCSDDESHQEFLNKYDSEIYRLAMIMPTPQLKNRTEEIRSHIISNKYTSYVVFEDDHFIDDILNPIMVNPSLGIQDEHIEKAYKILN